MSVLHLDNFGGYGDAPESILTAGLYAGLYDTTVGSGYISFPFNPNGGSTRVIRFSNSGQNAATMVRKVLPNTATTIGVTSRVWFPQLPTQGWNYPMVLMSALGNKLYTLLVTSTGRIEIRSGSYNGTILYTSAAPVITAQGWWHIEWKTVIDNSAGSLEVRVEGIPVVGLTQTGINTGTIPVAQVAMGQTGQGGGGGFPHYQTDLAVWDNSGTYANDWIGTSLVWRSLLTEDVSNPWGITGGTTGVGILNATPAAPNRYISAGHDPIPGEYIASIGELPEDITSIKAVMIRYMAGKNDGGDASFQAGLIADPEGTADVWNGANRPLTIAQTFYDDINHVNPKTGAPWTPAEFDEALLRLNRTS